MRYNALQYLVQLYITLILNMVLVTLISNNIFIYASDSHTKILLYIYEILLRVLLQIQNYKNMSNDIKHVFVI